MKQPSYVAEGNRYATEYELRKPRFKIHQTLGHARNSRNNHIGSVWGYNDNEWKSGPSGTIEGFLQRHSFDIYKQDGEGWVHMPEESFDPLTILDLEIHPYCTNGWRVSKYKHEPKWVDRVWYRRKRS